MTDVNRISHKLKVSIRDRRRVLFDGEAKALSSFNALGEFDVLPRHANFVSLIKGRVVIDKGSSDERIFQVESGLINVDENGVTVYVGIGKD